MKRAAKVTKVKGRNLPWMVRWRDASNADKRQYLATKAEAVSVCERVNVALANHGTKHGTFTDAERSAIIAFRDAVEKMPEPRPTLSDAVNAFLESIANQLKPVTVSELVAMRLASAEARGVHDRTLRDLGGADGKKGRLGAFAAKFGKREAAAITSDEIERWSYGHCKTNATRREVLVRVNGLFAYGVKRGFLRENPVQRLEKPRPNAPLADVLEVPQVAALMNACPREIIPAVAVQLFAGLRKAEAERLNWADIDFQRDTIRVKQRKGTKTQREVLRFAPLLPTLRAWLEPHRLIVGPIFPLSTRKHRKGEVSGQIYRKGFEAARTAAKIEAWDENTLRHCFGSYRYSSISDLARVAAEMGHTKTSTTLNHYVNARTPEETEAFWAVVPGGAKPGKVGTIPSRAIA